VEAGELTVVFWVEPFGLASTWTQMPDEIKLSFAEPGTLSEQFTIVVGELATIMKALADPTRLRILRLIRHFDLDNTQIASYLNISRPTVSVHARVLREAGLITTERTGRQARHTVNPGALERVYDALGSLFDVTED
jgi:ArsR family transcriptional regulator